MENTCYTRWKKVELLGMDEALKEECNYFIKGLIGSGFELNNDKDIIIWSWDTKDGQVSAKKHMKYNYWSMWLVEKSSGM